MRGAVEGLCSPHPLGTHLPALYQDDGFAQRLMSAFDQVLAPVFSVLDNFDAYIDPTLTAEDFLGWLAGWMGVELDQTWPLDRQRALVLQAAELYRRRGTVIGLREQLEIVTGATVEVIDSGGVAWSRTPGAQLPGTAPASVTVRVTAAGSSALDIGRIEQMVSAAKPAHVPHRLEMVEP
jgi:phage tail-like protein